MVKRLLKGFIAIVCLFAITIPTTIFAEDKPVITSLVQNFDNTVNPNEAFAWDKIEITASINGQDNPIVVTDTNLEITNKKVYAIASDGSETEVGLDTTLVPGNTYKVTYDLYFGNDTKYDFVTGVEGHRTFKRDPNKVTDSTIDSKVNATDQVLSVSFKFKVLESSTPTPTPTPTEDKELIISIHQSIYTSVKVNEPFVNDNFSIHFTKKVEGSGYGEEVYDAQVSIVKSTLFEVVDGQLQEIAIDSVMLPGHTYELQTDIDYSDDTKYDYRSTLTNGSAYSETHVSSLGTSNTVDTDNKIIHAVANFTIQTEDEPVQTKKRITAMSQSIGSAVIPNEAFKSENVSLSFMANLEEGQGSVFVSDTNVTVVGKKLYEVVDGQLQPVELNAVMEPGHTYEYHRDIYYGNDEKYDYERVFTDAGSFDPKFASLDEFTHEVDKDADMIYAVVRFTVEGQSEPVVEPEKPTTPNTDTKQVVTPKTGDETSVYGYTLMIAIAVVCIGLIKRKVNG